MDGLSSAGSVSPSCCQRIFGLCLTRFAFWVLLLLRHIVLIFIFFPSLGHHPSTVVKQMDSRLGFMYEKLVPTFNLKTSSEDLPPPQPGRDR